MIVVRVRFQIIGNARIENVGKSQSCMVSIAQVEFEPWDSEDEAEPERAPVRRFLRPSVRLQQVSRIPLLCR